MTRLIGCFALLCGVSATVSAQNYFPLPIPKSELTVGIRDFVQIPDSSVGQPPRLSLVTRDPLGRLFANDQRGPLYSIPADGNSVTEYLDLRDYPELSLVSTSEAGFQSFAFHPEFSDPSAAGYGRFYTIHSSSNTSTAPDFDPGGGTSFHTLLVEWQAASPTAATFVPVNADRPFREILRLDQPFGNHNAGLIAFNPTVTSAEGDYGNLYVAVGDGGSGGDPQGNGQELSNPYGALLRIDPLGANGINGQYGIVADNAFAADANPSTLGEIYAYGLRNPQRFGWDTMTGNTYIADIGQGAVEEIDLAVNGGNFGWNNREGSFQFEGGDMEGLIDPIAEYDHTNTFIDPPTRIGNRAVTVGEVARQTGIPGLDGQLLLGDFPTGMIMHLDVDRDPFDGGQDGLSELQLVDEDLADVNLLGLVNQARARRGLGSVSRVDLRFSFDTPGEVFVTNKHDGIIRQLATVPEPVSVVPLAAAMWLVAWSSRRSVATTVTRDSRLG